MRERMEPSEFEQRMLVAVAALREGEVVSYGDIAAKAGRPNAPRAAGRFLAKSRYQIPWWRVVYSSGAIAECNLPKQANKLSMEGVEIRNQKVVHSPLGRFAKSKRTRERS